MILLTPRSRRRLAGLAGHRGRRRRGPHRRRDLPGAGEGGQRRAARRGPSVHRAVRGLQRPVGAGRRRRGADHPARRRGAARRLLPRDLRRALRTGTEYRQAMVDAGQGADPDHTRRGGDRSRPADSRPGWPDVTATVAGPPAGSRRPRWSTRARRPSSPADEEILPCGRGPATPTRSAPPTTAAGTNFALFSEVAERVELCLFSQPGQGDQGPAHRGRRVRPPRLPAHRRARASATATGCTGPTTRRAGLRCNPNKLLVDPYSKAVDGPVAWDEAVFGYPFGDPDGRNDTDSARVRAEVGGGQPVLRLGHRPVAAHPLPRDGDLRGARARAHRRHPEIPRSAARHLRRPGAPGDDRPPAAASASRRSS